MAIAAQDKLLATIEAPFGLNRTETGRLFGVTRQAVESWHVDGVPSRRQEKAAAVAGIADLLSRRLKPERLPGIARRPAEAYGGLTMLEMIERDRHLELLAIVRASFDWAQTA
ncbi:MAG: hypothetical protein M3331_06995 [Actinomycetota bacterium]|nr:hypothetical protein [Actinomycetota bacterium]